MNERERSEAKPTRRVRGTKGACLRMLLCAGSLVLLMPVIAWASQVNVYIAQTAQGSADGFSCANARVVSFFNTASNWGSGSSQIGPGTTVHLCGVFTGAAGNTMLTVQNSGSAGNPITILFESGTVLTNAYWGASGAITASSKNYITIDGGTNGIIQATDNGSPSLGKAYQTYSNGIYLNGCSNCEIRNLHIQDMYVRVQSDTTTGAISGNNNNRVDGIEIWGNFSGLSIHDNTIHDVATGINMIYPASATTNTINVYNNTIYHISHGVNLGSASSNGTVNNPSIYNNEIYDGANWLDPADYFHADGIMVWAENTGNIVNNLKIYNNYVYGDWNPGSHLTAHIFLAMTNAAPFVNTWIYNNVLVASAGSAPANGHIQIQGGLTDAVIANNTFVGPGPGYGIYIRNGGTGNSGIVIRNNLIKDLDYYIVAETGLSVSNNNLVYQGGRKFRTGSIDYQSLASWQALGWDLNSQEADPLISETYHLLSGSPAINAGADLSSVFTTDKDGNTRTTWDIGAYQYVASILYGDVSENGSVTAYDASLASQYAVGLITLTSIQITKADVSGNGSVSAYDASLIAQYAVGLITKFPVEG